MLVYKNQFLEIHPYTGGGKHIPAGLPYPPPKILERLQLLKQLTAITISIANHCSKSGWGQDKPAGIGCPPTLHLEVIILSVNSHRSKILGGGKVNQLGYVAPHLYMDEFQEIGFCIPAGSICIL